MCCMFFNQFQQREGVVVRLRNVHLEGSHVAHADRDDHRVGVRIHHLDGVADAGVVAQHRQHLGVPTFKLQRGNDRVGNSARD